jgi:hypothetical protein
MPKKKTYKITLTVDEDLHEYIMEQTGGSKWHRGGYIKSILYQHKNKRIYLASPNANGNGSDHQAGTVRTKNGGFAMGTALYDTSKVSMMDLNSELKNAFKERGLKFS